VMDVIMRVARALAPLVQPIAEMLESVNEFVSTIERMIREFVYLLEQSKEVQCALDILKPASDIIDVATCPVGEVVNFLSHQFIDKLMRQVTNMVNKAFAKGIVAIVDLVVPDDLEFEIPDIKKFIPSEFQLATCAAASVVYPEYASLIQGSLAKYNAITFPHPVTSQSIKGAILDQALPEYMERTAKGKHCSQNTDKVLKEFGGVGTATTPTNFRHGCSGHHGAKSNDRVCCDEPGLMKNEVQACPADFPVCVGFRQGRAWGKCHRTLTNVRDQCEEYCLRTPACNYCSVYQPSPNAWQWNAIPECGAKRSFPEGQLMGDVSSKTREFTLVVAGNYESSCAEAWKEMSSAPDYKQCTSLLPGDIGSTLDKVFGLF